MNPTPAKSALPKRILLVTPDFPPFPIGGGALVCERLATEYQRMGWQVTVLSMNPSRAGVLARPLELDGPSGRVTFLPMAAHVETSGVSLLLVLPPSLPGLVRLMREFHRAGWDAVHLHGNPSFLVDSVGLLCRLGSSPYVLTFHGVIANPARFGRVGSYLYRALIAFERRVFDRAAAITAVSATTLNEVRDLGFVGRRMMVIPNAGFLPDPRTESGEGSRAVLTRLGLAPRSYALCLGAFIPRKGQDLLLRVFADLTAHGELPETLQLVLAGFERDLAYSASLRRIVAGAGLESRVHFLGEVSESEKDVLLHASRWVVMPSLYEASPVLAFEAMAAGCVLVAPDLPNFREIIGEDTNAAIFHAGDAASLSRTLVGLARDPAREQAIRVAALHRSQSFATWPEVARAYLELFSAPVGRSDAETSRQASEHDGTDWKSPEKITKSRP